MKRPLAAFGCIHFSTLLALMQWQPGRFFLVVFAAIQLSVAFVFFLRCFRQRREKQYVLLFSSAILLAIVLYTGHARFVVQPLANLTGQEFAATARVQQSAPSYGGDTLRAELQVLTLDGKPAPRGLKVSISGFPEVQVGDVVSVRLRFYTFNAQATSYHYAKGFYVGARIASQVQVTGQSLTLLCRLRLLKYAAGENIRSRLPLRLSTVASAMVVGDSRFLTSQAKNAYRAAGLSHLLVVSGAHLSVLCAALFAFVCRITQRRRLAAAVCIGFTLLFMAFTGFTSSIARSGIAFLLVYSAVLANRRADVYTSLAVAALVLCVANPYATRDVGLLLSFSATIGVVIGSSIKRRWQHSCKRTQNIVVTGLRWCIGLCITPLAVTFATLPILLLFKLGFSLFSIPVNILVIPLLAPVLLLGFLCALPAWPVLDALARVAALFEGILLVFLEKLTSVCAGFRGTTLFIGGAVALSVLLLYPLGYLALKSRRFVAYAMVGALLVSMGVALHTALTAGTVQVSVVGSGSSTSLVIIKDNQAAVIYRDRRTLYAVQKQLSQQGVQQCVLLIDLRQTSSSTEYMQTLQPAKVVVASEDIRSRAKFAVFQQVDVYILKQGQGMAACVDVAGYKIGLAAGSFDFLHYAPLDVLVAGRSEVQGKYKTLLVAGEAPEWGAPQGAVFVSEGQPTILLRPGKSVIFREVLDVDDFG